MCVCVCVCVYVCVCVLIISNPSSNRNPKINSFIGRLSGNMLERRMCMEWRDHLSLATYGKWIRIFHRALSKPLHVKAWLSLGLGLGLWLSLDYIVL